MTTKREFWTGVLAGIIALAALLQPSTVGAQAASPLTVQPSTGRVGVGNTSPGYTLDVNGTINAATFQVNAPDTTTASQVKLSEAADDKAVLERPAGTAHLDIRTSPEESFPRRV